MSSEPTTTEEQKSEPEWAEYGLSVFELYTSEYRVEATSRAHAIKLCYDGKAERVEDPEYASMAHEFGSAASELGIDYAGLKLLGFSPTAQDPEIWENLIEGINAVWLIQNEQQAEQPAEQPKPTVKLNFLTDGWICRMHAISHWRLCDTATNAWTGIIETFAGDELIDLSNWARKDFEAAFLFADSLTESHNRLRFGIHRTIPSTVPQIKLTRPTNERIDEGYELFSVNDHNANRWVVLGSDMWQIQRIDDPSTLDDMPEDARVMHESDDAAIAHVKKLAIEGNLAAREVISELVRTQSYEAKRFNLRVTW